VGKINNYRFARGTGSAGSTGSASFSESSAQQSQKAQQAQTPQQDPRVQLRAQQFQQVQRSQQHNLTRSLRFLTLSFSMGLNAGSFSPIMGRSSLRRNFKQAVQVLISRNLVETAGCQREIDVGLM
jgi:hypothetical protein